MRGIAVVGEVAMAILALCRDAKSQLIVDGNVLRCIDVGEIVVADLEIDPGFAASDDRAVADDIDRAAVCVPAVDGALGTAQYFDVIDVVESGRQTLRTA